MNKPLTCSVAMATFNGVKYIAEQLQSFCGQSHLPDELVVCDDGSTDATVSLVEEFARKAPFRTRIYVNSSRLGYARNFEKAIQLCEGDVIFLSDQDDVWKPVKIQNMLQPMQLDPTISFVICNAELVDDRLSPLGIHLWKKFGFTEQDVEAVGNHDYSILVQKAPAFGCCLALRSVFRNELFPLPQSWAHDVWIVMYLSAVYQCRFLPECLNSYRQHAAQASGARPSGISRAWRRIKRPPPNDYLSVMARRYFVLNEKLVGHPSEKLKVTMPFIHAARMHFENRNAGRSSWILRIPLSFCELCSGRYHRFSRGMVTFASDLVSPRTTFIQNSK